MTEPLEISLRVIGKDNLSINTHSKVLINVFQSPSSEVMDLLVKSRLLHSSQAADWEYQFILINQKNVHKQISDWEIKNDEHWYRTDLTHWDVKQTNIL